MTDHALLSFAMYAEETQQRERPEMNMSELVFSGTRGRVVFETAVCIPNHVKGVHPSECPRIAEAIHRLKRRKLGTRRSNCVVARR